MTSRKNKAIGKRKEKIAQGIIQTKSASSSRMLPLLIFDQKVPFFPKIVLF